MSTARSPSEDRLGDGEARLLERFDHVPEDALELLDAAHLVEGVAEVRLRSVDRVEQRDALAVDRLQNALSRARASALTARSPCARRGSSDRRAAAAGASGKRVKRFGKWISNSPCPARRHLVRRLAGLDERRHPEVVPVGHRRPHEAGVHDTDADALRVEVEIERFREVDHRRLRRAVDKALGNPGSRPPRTPARWCRLPWATSRGTMAARLLKQP